MAIQWQLLKIRHMAVLRVSIRGPSSSFRDQRRRFRCACYCSLLSLPDPPYWAALNFRKDTRGRVETLAQLSGRLGMVWCRRNGSAKGHGKSNKSGIRAFPRKTESKKNWSRFNRARVRKMTKIAGCAGRGFRGLKSVGGFSHDKIRTPRE
jgi:hypothetical protein